MDKKRLIDADELLSNGFITKNVRFMRGRFCIPWGDIKRSVKNAPTVDAVEVVRCKDCKHNCDGRCYGPQYICAEEGYDFYVGDDDFCSYGERKDNG